MTSVLDSLSRARHLCALLLLMALAPTGCSQAVESAVGEALKRLEIKVHSVTLKLEHPAPPALQLSMDIYNVNSRWVIIEQVHYVAYVGDREFHAGRLFGDENAVWVKADGGITVQVEMPISPELVARMAGEAFRGPMADRTLSVAGSIQYRTVFGASEHDFRTENVRLELRELNIKVKLPPGFPFPPSPTDAFDLDEDI